jgi:hypothetical protein
MYSEDDLLPIAALQHIPFCEWQCALIHIEQVWAENRDATVVFCDWFISKQSHTHDQMVQAARSGKQNHAYGVTEGCMASETCSG